MFELVSKTLVSKFLRNSHPRYSSMELSLPGVPLTVTHFMVIDNFACVSPYQRCSPVPSLSIATMFAEISTSIVLGLEQELYNSVCPTSVLADGRGPIIGLNFELHNPGQYNKRCRVETVENCPKGNHLCRAQIAVPNAPLRMADMRKQNCPQGQQSWQGEKRQNRTLRRHDSIFYLIAASASKISLRTTTA